MMHQSPLPREVALRVALAVREVPGVDLTTFVRALIELSEGPLTLENLGNIGPRRLRELLRQNSPISHSMAHRAVECLRTTKAAGSLYRRIPSPDTKRLTEPSLRVAFSSSEGRLLDAGYSACRRFLIYEVGKTDESLTAIRPTRTRNASKDAMAERAELVSDCSILYTLSIGAADVARLVKSRVHVVRINRLISCAHMIRRLREVLQDSPPPWMSKALGGPVPPVALTELS